MEMIKFKEGVSWDFSLTKDWDYVLPILEAAAKIYNDYNQIPVVTSMMDGKHSEGSLHYEGKAIDLRTFYFTTDEAKQVTQELQIELGEDYDVVLESTHIHCEYDPN